MKISGLCLMVSTIVMVLAGVAKIGHFLTQPIITVLVLIAVAISCLGALELKIHRRTRSAQQRTANTLAAAFRNGVLQ